MPIALTEEHEALRLTAQRWLQTHCPPSVPRAAAESATAELPGAWEKMAAQGWLGLHLPEADGGQGFGLEELAVVLEELGYALFPGPVLSTVSGGRRHRPARQRGAAGQPSCPDWPTAPPRPAVALGAGLLQRSPDGSTVSGTLAPGAGGAHRGRWSWLRSTEGGWCLLPRGPGLSIETLPALDATRPVGHVVVQDIALTEETRLPGLSDRRRARSGPGPGGGRGGGRGPLVPRHGLGVRQGAGAVRPAHRAVPGHQARAGRHAGGRRADGRRGLGRRRGLERCPRTRRRTSAP